MVFFSAFFRLIKFVAEQVLFANKNTNNSNKYIDPITNLLVLTIILVQQKILNVKKN